jgi:hypothetical protein
MYDDIVNVSLGLNPIYAGLVRESLCNVHEDDVTLVRGLRLDEIWRVARHTPMIRAGLEASRCRLY